MMPTQMPAGSNAWRDGVDEWGRIWRDGVYVSGAVDTLEDLARHTPSLDLVAQRFDAGRVRAARDAYPDHALIFGTHNGPFTAGYMAMGLERFFLRLHDDIRFVRRLLAMRTEWAIAVYRRAVDLGAEVIVLGDDAGSTRGPMIPPGLWRELVLPFHRRIVDALDVSVVWHSDGNIAPLLPMAIEAGFAGVHGLDPIAGMDLPAIRAQVGDDLTLIGNVDVRTLCRPDLAAVRREVDRCLVQGGRRGYMLATCNSIFAGMDPRAVREYFRYSSSLVS
jgi:uroporphyrinogen decarboxylase